MGFGLLVLLYVVMAAYLPVSRLLPPGRSLATRLDAHVPLVPYLGPVYVFGMLPIAALPLVFWLQLPPAEFRSFALATIGGAAVTYLLYFLVPTEIERPDLPSGPAARFCLGLAYAARSPRGIFPSGHAFYTALNCRFLFQVLDPAWGWLAAAGSLLIIAAALLTRLHTLLDILAGLALAGLGIALAGALAP